MTIGMTLGEGSTKRSHALPHDLIVLLPYWMIALKGDKFLLCSVAISKRAWWVSGLWSYLTEMRQLTRCSRPPNFQCFYECCIRKRYFPAFWKTAKIVISLKSPEQNRNNPRSLRAISLLPAFGKVLRRIMAEKLGWKHPIWCQIGSTAYKLEVHWRRVSVCEMSTSLQSL